MVVLDQRMLCTVCIINVLIRYTNTQQPQIHISAAGGDCYKQTNNKNQLPSKFDYRTCIEELNNERPTMLVFFFGSHETSPVIWICIVCICKPALAIQSKLGVEHR
jgi:hypothetical protein